MVSFGAIEDGEIFIMNDDYYMKTSNTLGDSYGVNLETGTLHTIERDEPVTETNGNTKEIAWHELC